MIAIRISAPPMVGVPAFDRWLFGPSSRIAWPTWYWRNLRIMIGPTKKAMNSAVSTLKMARSVMYCTTRKPLWYCARKSASQSSISVVPPLLATPRLRLPCEHCASLSPAPCPLAPEHPLPHAPPPWHLPPAARVRQILQRPARPRRPPPTGQVLPRRHSDRARDESHHWSGRVHRGHQAPAHAVPAAP